MKLTFISLFVTFWSFMSSAQQADTRLFELYSQEEIQAISDKSPERIAILNYAIDHAMSITDMPSGKESKLNGEVSVEISSDLNFIKLGKKVAESNQYFRISGTDKMIVIKSYFVLENEMNAAN